jgi:hypothetical protein
MAKVPEANNIWQEYELGSRFNAEDAVARFGYPLFVCFGVSFQVRNYFSDSFDIALKTLADLAKITKSQVTFSAFNSVKISSVQPHRTQKFFCFRPNSCREASMRRPSLKVLVVDKRRSPTESVLFLFYSLNLD